MSGPPPPPLVSVRDLGKTYPLGGRAVQALAGVTAEIGPGEFVAIMGPSGSGKSTFLSLLGCLARPSEGEYRLAGSDAVAAGDDALAALRNRLIGFVFQQYNLLPRATALENVELPLLYREGCPAEERRRRALAALEAVGLGGHARRWPGQLSGGEQQRVAIARALAGGPRLLLADEPTGALDAATGRLVLRLFRALNSAGVAVVLSTHDPDVAAVADRVLRFSDGRLVGDRPQRPSLPAQRRRRLDADGRGVEGLAA